MIKRLRWQLIIVFLALVAIAALLLSQQPVAITPVIATEPVAGGVYSEGLIGAFSRLNPLLDFYNQPDRDVDRLLFSSLVRFDDRGIPQGEVAESWGISSDGQVYNFALRKDVVWHDGQPLTSADVIFTIELMRDPELPIPADIRKLWQSIEVEAFDEYTLQFRLPEPFAPFIDYLNFGILPQHILEGVTASELINHQFNAMPVGSGPYRFNHWLVEDGVTVGVSLLANDDYFLGRPYIDEVVFRYYADETAALQAYQDGEILGIAHIGDDILDAALKEPELNFYSTRMPEVSLIYLNLDNPAVPYFQDVNVRKALLYALNRQGMVNRIYRGQATIADGPILPNTWAYYEGIGRIPFEPEKAIDLLKEAGYVIPAEGGNVRQSEDGERLSFTLLHPDDALHTQIASEIQKYWEAVGVEVKLTALPYDELVEEYLSPRLYEAALVELDFTRSPDPDPYPFWHQTQATSGQNYSLWNDRQASEYIEQARIIVDPEERTRLYRNFQVRFANELPALPLFYPIYTYGVDAQVQGVRIGPIFEPSDRFGTITRWFFFSEQTVGVNNTPTP